MKQYRQALLKILAENNTKDDRTGTGTISVFGHQMRFDISDGKMPMITGKRVPYKSTTHEVIWFLSGSTNIRYLEQNGCIFWREWPYKEYLRKVDNLVITDESDDRLLQQSYIIDADTGLFRKLTLEEFGKRIVDSKEFAELYGSIGLGYGKQWRDFNGVDQIKNVIDTIRTNPDSRRMIVSAWNPAEVSEMLLPPCHCFFQFYVRDNKLSCQIYVRSNDMGLGFPTNVYQYSLLTHMIANMTGLETGELVYSIGDMHIYKNHIDGIATYLDREIFEQTTTVRFNQNKEYNSVEDYTFDDIIIEGYKSHPMIKMPVAV